MIDSWFAEHLVCPLHKTPVSEQAAMLVCAQGCRFHVVAGVPCMLPEERSDADALAQVRQAAGRADAPADQLDRLERSAPTGDQIDPWVQHNIFLSNSALYADLGGKLRRYPIPELPLPVPESPNLLLDLGCNWGRWCLSAAQKGYEPIGIDLSLPSILAAVRVNQQLGLNARYLVADSRYLPFRRDQFDTVFSYSSLQHISKDDVKQVFTELRQVLKTDGVAKLHLLNRYGVRSMQSQIKRRFRDPQGIEARFWTPAEMICTSESTLGPSHLEIDGFFSQGQRTDFDILPARYRQLVRVSDALKRASHYVPLLGKFADQMFVVADSPSAAPVAKPR